MSLEPKVAVVILNWNGRHYLQQFLPSVLATAYANFEVVVIDNASTDDSIAYLRSNFPTVRIIRNDSNLGFAGGYNTGLKQVAADYYVLLNSDLEVSPNWLRPVIDLMEKDPAIAVAQPKIKDFYHKETFEYAGAAGGFIDKYGYPFCRGRIFDTVESDEGQYDEESEIFWASGAALFIRTSCWKQVEGFDAHFFAHMEEIDLCWRLKNLGYKVYYCPASEVYHVGGGTLGSESPFKAYLNFRNNLAMLLKNLPSGKRLPVLFVRFWLDFITLIRFLLQGKFKHARAINKAHLAFFRDLRRNKRLSSANYPLFNRAGYYPKSIVWDYFFKNKKTFSSLKS